MLTQTVTDRVKRDKSRKVNKTSVRLNSNMT